MRSLWIVLTLFALVVLLPGSTYAQASASQRKAAAEAYDRGTADYLGGEFSRAAQWFETAHRMAPAAPALMQAVRAHLKADNRAQAASLALRLRNEYPDVGQAVAYANATLDEIGGEFVRVDVICEDCRIDLDGKIQESSSFYLEPGSNHTVTASFATGDVAQQVSGGPGDSRELVFDAPPASDPIAEDVPLHNTARVAPTDSISTSDGGGLSPLITYIGAGVTGALLIGTVVTYLSLNSKNDDYISATNAVKACSDDDGCTVEMQMGLFNTADKKKDDALGAQDINNILLLSSIGVAVGTAAIAIFFTNWDDDSANEDSTARLTFDVKPVQDGAIATLRGRFE